MEYKVIATVDGETWQYYNQQGVEGALVTKRDKNYMERVLLALKAALKHAEKEYLNVKY